jgi:hypothetical protein
LLSILVDSSKAWMSADATFSPPSPTHFIKARQRVCFRIAIETLRRHFSRLNSSPYATRLLTFDDSQQKHRENTARTKPVTIHSRKFTRRAATAGDSLRSIRLRCPLPAKGPKATKIGGDNGAEGQPNTAHLIQEKEGRLNDRS